MPGGRGRRCPALAKPLVSDEVWAAVEPEVPPAPAKPKGGRPRVPDRVCLTGIVFVLQSGIPWEMLPQEMLPQAMGCGSGVTCWRRLRDWQQAGVWHRRPTKLRDRLGPADKIDRRRAAIDSRSFPAQRGASGPGRTRPIGGGPAATTTC